MSFTVRQIARRAGGGEIVRTRTIAKPALVIGRGADCDVRIADLAVRLHHATICRIGAAVRIETLGGAPLQLDGDYIERADLGLDAGAVLRLGGHRLTLTRGALDDAVLTVERREAVTRPDLDDEARAFMLAGLLPGQRTSAWLLGLLLLGAFLAWPIGGFLTAPQRAAPTAAMRVAALDGKGGVRPPVVAVAARPDASWGGGAMSSVHAGFADDCGACHQTAFASVTDGACRACHDKLADHAPPARLAASTLPLPPRAALERRVAHGFGKDAGRCAACHLEHEGPAGALRFGRTECAQCHAGLDARLTDTALANASDWRTDHPQFRPAVVVKPGALPVLRRVSLDAKPREKSGLVFPHAVHLAPAGSVARQAQTLAGRGRLDCGDCHRADANGIRHKPIVMERDCGACHSLALGGGTLPHGEPAAVVRAILASAGGGALLPARRPPGLAAPTGFARISAEARAGAPARGIATARAMFAPGGLCFDCHQVIAPARGLDFKIAPVSLGDHYLRQGPFPHVRHAKAPCATCHAAASSRNASDLLIPGIATCRNCHGAAKVAAAKAECENCHAWHPGTGVTAIPARTPDFATPRFDRGVARDGSARRADAAAAGLVARDAEIVRAAHREIAGERIIG